MAVEDKRWKTEKPVGANHGGDFAAQIQESFEDRREAGRLRQCTHRNDLSYPLQWKGAHVLADLEDDDPIASKGRLFVT
jgi:hypothetical protein